MRSLSLRYFVVRLWLDRMDKIGELDRLLDEEDGDVVADNVPIAFFGVEFGGETSNVSDGVCATSATLDGREANKGWGGAGSVGQDPSGGHILKTLEELELAMGTSASSMYNTFRDTLVVESMNAFSRDLVLEQRRADLVVLFVHHLQPVVQVGDLDTIVGCLVLLAVRILDILLEVGDLLVLEHVFGGVSH